MVHLRRRSARLLAAFALLFAAWGARAAELKAPLEGVPPLALPVAPLPAAAAAVAGLPQAAVLPPVRAPSALAPAVAPQLAAPALPPFAASSANALPLAAASDQKAPEAAAEGAARLFDGAGAAPSNAPIIPAPAPAGPRLPPGLERVVVGTVHTEADVLRLIPYGYSPNSGNLTRKLASNVGRMAPYDVYTYFDKKGGKIIAIDLSRKPDLIKILPEQQSHEVRLIKKIQAWNLDLQVVVREEGATPDLIIGGVFTELKTRGGQRLKLTQLLDKANSQVAAHALRHGPREGESLGPGAVVLDLARRESGVPMPEVTEELDSWRRSMAASGRAVALKKIYVFGGGELREFDRQADGSYAAAARAVIPFAPLGKVPQRSVRRAQPSGPRTALAEAFARSRIEKTVRHWCAKGRYRSALRAWEEFSASADPDETARVRARLGRLLDAAEEKLANPRPRYRR